MSIFGIDHIFSKTNIVKSLFILGIYQYNPTIYYYVGAFQFMFYSYKIYSLKQHLSGLFLNKSTKQWTKM